MSEQKLVAESFDITIHMQKNNKVYRFVIPYGAPFAESYEILNELAEHVKKMEEKAQEFAKQQEEAKQEPQEVNV